MDLVYSLYDQLLWIHDNEGKKIAYMHYSEVEELDIFGWLDYQIYLNKKIELETIAKYDNAGL